MSDARPAGDGVSSRTWWTTMVYVAAAAMLLRFYALPLKPLHHDEGVNTLLLVNLVRPPHVYQYDPIN
jgi:predicted membrane-bound mannosyltransferase